MIVLTSTHHNKEFNHHRVLSRPALKFHIHSCNMNSELFVEKELQKCINQLGDSCIMGVFNFILQLNSLSPLVFKSGCSEFLNSYYFCAIGFWVSLDSQLYSVCYCGCYGCHGCGMQALVISGFMPIFIHCIFICVQFNFSMYI